MPVIHVVPLRMLGEFVEDARKLAISEKPEGLELDLVDPAVYALISKTMPKITPPKRKLRGLGDVIHKVTSKLGIKQCGGCAARQSALNSRFPFKT